jgi:hypothetical protein
MTETDDYAHERDARDLDGAERERRAADSEPHVHTHADGPTHAHPHEHARRPGFLARLFGAPG